MELLCHVASASNPGKPAKGQAQQAAECVLVSHGESDQHKKAVGENGQVRISLRAEGGSFGGELAGVLKSGDEYEVIIRRKKKASQPSGGRASQVGGEPASQG